MKHTHLYVYTVEGAEEGYYILFTPKIIQDDLFDELEEINDNQENHILPPYPIRQ